MPIEVIATPAIEQVLTQKLAEASIEDVIVISAELAPNTMQLRGLDVALERVSNGQPILIQSFLSNELIRDMRYHALLGYPNVSFVRLPLSLAELVEAIKLIGSKPRPADPLAIALLGVKDPAEFAGTLNHDLKGPVDEPRILERARAAGYEGSDEAILIRIRDFRTTPLTPFAGQQFPDLFCDVEGTLIVDGQLNDRVVTYLRKQAEVRPITIWTGGNVQEYRRQLANKLPYKVVSKYLFGGTTITTAIDNEIRGWLEKSYRFNIEQLIPAFEFEN